MGYEAVDGLTVGNVRIWYLAYADDMVMIARNRKASMDVIDTLRKFLKRRRLELNTDKTKVVVFHKSRRERNEGWKWKRRNMEEVRTFKHLGFTLNRKDDYTDHIRKARRKGRIAANKVWGKNMYRDDFMRRWTSIRLFGEKCNGIWSITQLIKLLVKPPT